MDKQTRVRSLLGRRNRLIFQFQDGTQGSLWTNSAKPAPNGKSLVTNIRENGQEVILVSDNRALSTLHTLTFNSWINAKEFNRDTITTERTKAQDVPTPWRVRRRFEWMQEIVTGESRTTSLSKSKGVVDFMLCTYMIPEYDQYISRSNSRHEGCGKYRIETQMEKEINMQGETTQHSEQRENTIVTRDQGRTDTEERASTNLIDYVSTENTANMKEVVDRLLVLADIQVETKDKVGKVLAEYNVPRDILAQLASTSVALPFETYLYSYLECAMKFVVNANKFQVGKVICSIKFDGSHAKKQHLDVENALCRPHVILDLSCNNEGNLHIPFRFRRAMIRNILHPQASLSTRTGEYATVIVQVFSQLRAAPGQINRMSIRPFFHIAKAEFAGLTYRYSVTAQSMRVETQMDVIRTVSQSQGFQGLLRDIEGILDVGNNTNCDKPTELKRNIVVPCPRMNFCTGKGPVDAMVLRMNPSVMTPAKHISSYPDEPTDLLDVAKIWGLRNTVLWRKSQSAGAALGKFVIDPTSRLYDGSFSGTPTPLEYVCSMYNFWSGTIELRLDFVSNAFHTGAIMICIEFGRQVGTGSEEIQKASSTYTKTFHLGEQKSVTVTIPYIYDTIWRRSTSLAFNPEMLEVSQDQKSRSLAMNIRPRAFAQVVLRVINPLSPPDTITEEIEVQVFMRASESFRVHGLKQGSMYTLLERSPRANMDSFPRDEYIKKKEVVRKTRYVETQMDSGEKETLDPTDDFHTGQSNLQLQTLDVQTNIKDILRRPVLLFLDQSIEPYKVNKSMGFFIPLMPPSKMMAHIPGNEPVFSELVNQNPAAMIMNMFRFWRGSMRYTVIVKSGTTGAVYLTYVSHTGTRILGNQNVGNYTNPQFRPIFASGLPTEIMVPTVNSSCQIEVPYETTNNWTLTFEDDAGDNYSWRDKGDTNAGHLVLSTNLPITVDVWWSAGDDFQVANFYGIPAIEWDDADAALSDERIPVAVTQNRIETQMDGMMDFTWFDTANLRSCVNNTLNNLTATSVATAAMSSLPVVGNIVGALATNANITSVRSKTEKTLTNVDTLIENKISPAIDDIHQLVELVKGKIEEGLGSVIGWTKALTDLLNALFLTSASNSLWPVTTVVVNVLKDFAISSISPQYLTEVSQRLHRSLSNLFGSTTQTQALGEDEHHIIVSILVGIIGTIMGVVLDPKKNRNLGIELAQTFTEAKTMTYLNGVFVYVSRVISTIQNLIYEALGLVDPEAAALKFIMEDNKSMEKFIKEAQVVTSESMKHARGTPAFRQRYFVVIAQALQIQRAIMTTRGNPAAAVLMRFVTDILKKADEHMIDLRQCPYKMVPWVLTLEGASGIGKSYMAKHLAAELHDEIGVKPSPAGIIYTYQSGAAHWNNYGGQHVILVDDYGQRTDSESIKAETDMLFNLVTDAAYTPPMAALEDKKIYANPLSVLLLTNDAYANHLTAQNHDKEAYLRRRNIVVKVSVKEHYQGFVVDELPPSVLENFDHLEFQMYNSVTDSSRGFYPEKLNYQQFVTYARNNFHVHYNKKTQIMKDDLRKLQAKIMGQPIEEVVMGDPYKLFAEFNVDCLMEENLQHETLARLKEYAQAVVRSTRNLEENVDVVAPMPNPFAQAQVQLGETLLHQIEDAWLLLKNGATGVGLVFGDMLQGYTCATCERANVCEYMCKRTSKRWCRECVQNMDVQCILICPECKERHLQYYHSARSMALAGIAAMFATTAVDALAVIFSGKMHLLRTAAVLVMYAYVTRAVYYSHHPETQMGTETAVKTRYGEFEMEVVVDEVSAQACSSTRFEENLPCRHQALIDQRRNAIHVEGTTFRVLVDVDGTTEFLMVDIRPCGDHCPLADSTTLLAWMRNYALERKTDILRAYIAYLNEPARRDYHRNSIPPFVRPDWMTEIEIVFEKTWWTYLSEKFEKWKGVLSIVAAVGVGLSAIIALYRMFMPEADTQFGANWSGTSERSYMPRTTRNIYTRATRVDLETETQSGSLYSSTLIKETAAKIFRNQVVFRVWRENVPVRSMVGVGIRNRQVLVPRHYVDELQRSSKMGKRITVELAYAAVGSQNHTRQEYMFEPESITRSAETDLAIIMLPESVSLFKDIVNMFWTEADARSMHSSEGLLNLPCAVADTGRMVIRVDLEEPQANIVAYDPDGTKVVTRHVIPYNFSEKGACGAILLLPNTTRPIATMHTCGISNGPGFGVIVTQEMLAELAPVNVTQMEDKQFCEFEEVKPTIVFDDNVNVNYLGAVPSEQRPFMQKKSKIIPSDINNQYGFVAKTQPAILDVSDSRWKYDATPLYHGVKKHGIVLPPIPFSAIKSATEFVYINYFQQMKPLIVKPRRLTHKEAIVGLPMTPFYDAMKLTTSAGYPWSHMAAQKNKLAWITPIVDDNQQMVDCEIREELVQELVRKEKLRRKGVVPISIFTDTLKDERRPIQKVNSKGGTRVFCASPVDYTIALRQNLLHFCAATMKNRITNSTAVGINPLGPEWSKIAHKLLSRSATNIMNMDYSNFGPCFHATLCKAAGSIMKNWTIENVDDIDEVELECLIEECVNSVHIVQGTVYQQQSGSPSGAAFTVIINSIVNLLYMAIAWQSLAQEHCAQKSRSYWEEYTKNVSLIVYGDDLIAAVSEEYKRLFNPETIIASLARYGIVATDADKGEKAMFVTLEKASFLKRGFKRHGSAEGIWYAPLRWDVIEEIPQWRKKGLDKKQCMIATTYTALIEAHGHGKTKFNELKRKMNAAVSARNLHAQQVIEWEEVEALWQNEKLYIDALPSFDIGEELVKGF